MKKLSAHFKLIKTNKTMKRILISIMILFILNPCACQTPDLSYSKKYKIVYQIGNGFCEDHTDSYYIYNNGCLYYKNNLQKAVIVCGSYHIIELK